MHCIALRHTHTRLLSGVTLTCQLLNHAPHGHFLSEKWPCGLPAQLEPAANPYMTITDMASAAPSHSAHFAAVQVDKMGAIVRPGVSGFLLAHPRRIARKNCQLLNLQSGTVPPRL